MMQFYYQDFYAALPGFIGVDAVREALAAPSAVTAAGELPACPAPVMLRRRLTPLGRRTVRRRFELGRLRKKLSTRERNDGNRRRESRRLYVERS